MERDRILIIDHDLRFTARLRQCLQGEYTVFETHSAAEAVEQAERLEPSLIILGYLEPRGTAFQLHRELRGTANLRPPLLVVDVRAEEHSRRGWRKIEGLQMDAEGYLSRPVEYAELRAEVRRILESRSVAQIRWREFLERRASDLLENPQRRSEAASA